MIINTCTNTEKYINKCKEYVRAVFQKEDLSNEVFERWFNATINIYKENKIAVMCRRVIQGGVFVYPYKHGCNTRDGYLALINDEDVEGLVYVSEKEFKDYPGNTLYEKFCYAEKLINEKFG